MSLTYGVSFKESSVVFPACASHFCIVSAHTFAHSSCWKAYSLAFIKLYAQSNTKVC